MTREDRNEYMKNYMREYIKNNPDYKKKQKEKRIEKYGSTYNEEYYRKNKDKYKTSQKSWVEKNKDHINAYKRDYYKGDKETYFIRALQSALLRAQKTVRFKQKQRKHALNYYYRNRESVLAKMKDERKTPKYKLKQLQYKLKRWEQKFDETPIDNVVMYRRRQDKIVEIKKEIEKMQKLI